MEPNIREKPTPKRKSLQEARKSIGKTQAQFAADLGLSEIYVRKIEAGERTPGRDAIVKIGRYFNKPVYELFPDVFLVSDGFSAIR